MDIYIVLVLDVVYHKPAPEYSTTSNNLLTTPKDDLLLSHLEVLTIAGGACTFPPRKVVA
jgi:hypothetical protein